MFGLRRWSIALALATTTPWLAISDRAEAADVFAVGGLVEVLGVADLPGDGMTPVDVAVLALDVAGKPMTGLKFKPEATAGTVGAWTETGGGLYRFTWTPPLATADQDVTLTVRGKTPDKGIVAATRVVRVRSSGAATLGLTSNPESLVLGQTPEATLKIAGGDGALAVRSSAGQILDLTDMGANRSTARFVTPKVNYPQLAVITSIDGAGTGNGVGATALPLSGSVEYPVEAPPNATVLLKIAGREFGPRQASAQGQAIVPIVVPPGVTRGTIVSVVNGQTTELPLDLKVPETRNVALFAMPSAVPAGTRIPVRVAKFTPDGKPDPNARVELTVSKGTLEPAVHTSNGVYLAWWTAPTAEGPVTIEVDIPGSAVQKDALTVNVLPPRPTRVDVTTDPTTIQDGLSQLRVFVHLTGPNGEGLSGRDLAILPTGGKPVGTVKDLKNGDYQLTVAPADAGNLTVQVVPKPPVSTNPVRHIVLLPASERILNNGNRSMNVVVAAVDAFGNPVANTPVELGVLSGGGRIPAKVTTDANGLAFVDYTSGTSAGLVRLTASAGTASGAANLLALPPDVGAIDLPDVGTPSQVATSKAWGEGVRTLEVPRAGSAVAAAGVVAAVPDATPKVEGAPIDRFEVLLDPATGVPGGSVALTVRALDAKGQPAAGRRLDWLTSAGTLTPQTEVEPGAYRSVLQAPAGFTGEVKVSIVAPNGTTTLTRVNFAAAAAVASGPAWGTTDSAPAPAPTAVAAPTQALTPTTESVAKTETPKPPKEPKAAKQPKSDGGDHPMLRAHASGVVSSYSYLQSPGADPGPLLPQTLSVGGSAGGSPAVPVGFDLDGRAWFMDYLGAHANFRGTTYAIAAAVFSQPAPDWLYDITAEVIGRVPFDLGDDQVWIGAKAGYKYNDFMIFTGCFDPGCQVNFDALGVHGLGVGGEAGAELGDFYLVAGYTHGLANGSTPYASIVDADLGWDITENFHANLGFSSIGRDVDLAGAESEAIRGTLSDDQLVFRLGAGITY